MVRPVTCPICKKPIVAASTPDQDFAPFCSERCKRVDFFRWTDGKYAIVETLDPSQLPQPSDIPGDEEYGEELMADE